jgi:ABC-2 type transport system permease protein
MSKYFLFAWISLLNLIEYRLNFFWSLGGTILQTLMLYMFWTAVLGSGFGNGLYDISSIGLYYLFIMFVSAFTDFGHYRIANLINNGDLGMELVKPYNFLIKEFAQTIPNKIINLFIVIFIYQLLLFIGLKHQINLTHILFSIVAVTLASISKFYIGMVIGGLGFWFKRVHGFNALFWNIGGLFSGDLLPLNIMPAILFSISAYLPFRYLAYFPVQIMLGKIGFGSELIIGLFIQVLWALVFAFIYKIVWKFGMLEFDASGK